MCEYVTERERDSGPKRPRSTLTPLPPASQKNTVGRGEYVGGMFFKVH